MKLAVFSCAAVFLMSAPTRADIVSRESEIAGIRLGQHVLVDDGSCPAGQIKEITGKKLTEQGITGVRKCIERKSAKR